METQRSSGVKFWTLIVLFTVLGSATLGAYLMAAPANVNRFYPGGLSLVTGGDGYSIGADVQLSRSAANIWTLGAGDSLIGVTDLNATDVHASNLYANTALIDGYYPGSSPSYTIGVDGATYWARNEATGAITTNANAATLLNSISGSICVKPGNYTLLSTVQLGEGTRIYGEGNPDISYGAATTTVARFKVDGITAFNVTSDSAEISRLIIYSTSAAATPIGINAIVPNKINLVISHVQFGGHFDRCVNLTRQIKTTIEYCDLSGSDITNFGIYDYLSNDITIYKTYIHYNVVGIEFVRTSISQIKNSIIESNQRDGIRLNGTMCVSILENYFENNAIEGTNAYNNIALERTTGIAQSVQTEISRNYFAVNTNLQTDIWVEYGFVVILNNNKCLSTTQHNLMVRSGDKLFCQSNWWSGGRDDILAWGNTAFSADGNYITESSGTATILNTATSIVVNHGLSFTPTAKYISVIPSELSTNDPGQLYVDTITSTQFTIHCRNDPGASNLDVAWNVHYTPP